MQREGSTQDRLSCGVGALDGKSVDPRLCLVRMRGDGGWRDEIGSAATGGCLGRERALVADPAFAPINCWRKDDGRAAMVPAATLIAYARGAPRFVGGRGGTNGVGRVREMGSDLFA